MPSSSDQYPDPWNPNVSDNSGESSDQDNDLDIDATEDDFGIEELEALLAERSGSETPRPRQEPAFEDLELLFPLDAEPQQDSSEPDFDELLASLRIEAEDSKLSESSEPSSSAIDSGSEPLIEPDSDSSIEESRLDSFVSAEIESIAEQPDFISDPSPSPISEVSSSSSPDEIEPDNLEGFSESPLPIESPLPTWDSDITDLSPTAEGIVGDDARSATQTPSETSEPENQENVINLEESVPVPPIDAIQPVFESDREIGDVQAEAPTDIFAEADEVSPPGESGVDSDDMPEMAAATRDDVAVPSPEGDRTDVFAIPVAPDVSVNQGPVETEDSSPEPVETPSGSDTDRESLVGARVSTTSPLTASSSASTGPSTYRQILSGRKPISAFALILAGMAGIMGYGWSKAGIQNPFRTDFNEPQIGLLADQDRSSDEETALAPSELPTATEEPASAQPGDRNKFLVPIPAPQTSQDGANQKATIIPNIGGLDSQTESEDVEVSTPEGPNDAELRTPPPIDISDVPPDHWVRPYVEAMYAQGILPDFPDGKFQPDKPVSRAELAASIQRAFKDEAGAEPIPFSDIPDQYWARDAITHAVNTGFMSGYSEDIFRPNQQIPRYQVLVSLVSGLGLSKIEDPQAATDVLQAFSDADKMPEWALGQVAASEEANLIINRPEDGGVLAPNRPASRAEVSAMIYQALVNAGKIEDTVN